MSQSKPLSTQEKIIVALACLVALAFFIFVPKSCQSGSTALSWRNWMGSDKSSQNQSPTTGSVAGVSQAKGGEALSGTKSNSVFVPAASEEESYLYEEQPLEPKLYHCTSEELGSAGVVATGAAAGALMQKDGGEGDCVDCEGPDCTKSDCKKCSESECEVTSNDEATGLAGMIEEKDQALAELNKQIEFLSLSKDDAVAQAAELQKAKLMETKALADEVEALKQKLAEVEAEKMKALEMSKLSENPPIAPIVKEEQKESSFVESEADLDESRKGLVLAIKQMESLRGAGLQSRYDEVASSLNARSLARIKFSSSKSDLRDVEAAKISALSKNVDSKSKFLVAGFADMSGTRDGNAKLSSARAKAVANSLGEKIGYSNVSAIYLGQTARFGEKPENRVVEIWELKASK